MGGGGTTRESSGKAEKTASTKNLRQDCIKYSRNSDETVVAGTCEQRKEVKD